MNSEYFLKERDEKTRTKPPRENLPKRHLKFKELKNLTTKP